MRKIEDEFSGLPRSVAYRKRHKDQIDQKRADHKFTNPSYWLYKAAKARSARKNIEFSIDISDIVVPEFCPVLGLKLEASHISATDNSPSLDRIDNTRGYVKGNVCVISNKANRLKGDATAEELKKVYEWLAGRTS